MTKKEILRKWPIQMHNNLLQMRYSVYSSRSVEWRPTDIWQTEMPNTKASFQLNTKNVFFSTKQHQYSEQMNAGRWMIYISKKLADVPRISWRIFTFLFKFSMKAKIIELLKCVALSRMNWMAHRAWDFRLHLPILFMFMTK